MEEDPKNGEDGFDEWDGQQELGEESLYIKLMTLAIDSGDDPRDEHVLYGPRNIKSQEENQKDSNGI